MSLSPADHAPRTRPARLTEEQRILDFAARWHRFGGGTAEDIFVMFGIDEREFAVRVLGILDALEAHLDPRFVGAVREVYDS
jgi:hypothetical protein